MTEWKPEAGKDAVVRVTGHMITTDGQKHAFIEGTRATIPISALRPLPTALSAEDAAVLAQADRAEQEISRRGTRWNEERDALLILVRQRRPRRSTPPTAAVPQDSAWVPKAGDRIRHKGTGILGTVAYVDDPPFPFVRFDNGNALWMTVDDLEIAPPRPDTTALRDAVVEAVRVYREKRKEYRMNPTAAGDGTISNARKALDAAHDALLAAEKPADPVAELREAAEAGARALELLAPLHGSTGHTATQDCGIRAAIRLRAAVAALDDRGRG